QRELTVVSASTMLPAKLGPGDAESPALSKYAVSVVPGIALPDQLLTSDQFMLTLAVASTPDQGITPAEAMEALAMMSANKAAILWGMFFIVQVRKSCGGTESKLSPGRGAVTNDGFPQGCI